MTTMSKTDNGYHFALPDKVFYGILTAVILSIMGAGFTTYSAVSRLEIERQYVNKDIAVNRAGVETNAARISEISTAMTTMTSEQKNISSDIGEIKEELKQMNRR